MNQEKIFFITDSACDIPAKDEQELENLCILPIPVTADGKGYYERESFTPEEFYDLIDSCENIPSTSHIPAIAFQEKYEQAWEKGYTHLVVVTIYSGASAMYQSALMAKNAFLEEHPDAMRIEVIDSNCYAMGYGYPIIQACHKALEGESFENVVSYIKDYLSRVKIYFSPFTLKYVKKSGRVSCCGRTDWPASGYFRCRNNQHRREGARQCCNPDNYGQILQGAAQQGRGKSTIHDSGCKRYRDE